MLPQLIVLKHHQNFLTSLIQVHFPHVPRHAQDQLNFPHCHAITQHVHLNEVFFVFRIILKAYDQLKVVEFLRLQRGLPLNRQHQLNIKYHLESECKSLLIHSRLNLFHCHTKIQSMFLSLKQELKVQALFINFMQV